MYMEKFEHKTLPIHFKDFAHLINGKFHIFFRQILFNYLHINLILSFFTSITILIAAIKIILNGHLNVINVACAGASCIFIVCPRINTTASMKYIALIG